MKFTAIAPANIALIKYWGKQDEKLRLPLNTSISMNLSGAYTTTTVEFSPEFTTDQITLINGQFSAREVGRIKDHLDRIRQKAGLTAFARVATQNNFPKRAGVASSASGFAALTLAACFASGLKLSEKELTILARFGSGSACRSIPAGFVEWLAAETTQGSYAYSLYPPNYWDLHDILLIVSQAEKKIASTAGMEQIKTSPFWQKRIAAVPPRIARLKQTLKAKDFSALGEVTEEDCLEMHQVMQTQNPPLFYWNEKTKEIMELVRSWRKRGLAVYFTIDAGPHVHLLCEAKDKDTVVTKVKNIAGIFKIMINKPAPGARLVYEHLF